MSAKLITLERWARENYGEDAPHINTLRRWARDAHISPLPKKHGRTYFVESSAKYVDHRPPEAARCAPTPRGRLVERLIHGR